MAEIAAAADVSRRTLYLYFPTLEQLLSDAALEATRATVDPEIEAFEDVGDRVEALVRATQRGFAETEHFGRAIIRLTVGSPAKPGSKPRRGYRRVEWIEKALEPIRAELDPERFERLVSGLTLLIGWESMIVMQDIRGLSHEEAEDVCVAAARALVAAETS